MLYIHVVGACFSLLAWRTIFLLPRLKNTSKCVIEAFKTVLFKIDNNNNRNTVGHENVYSLASTETFPTVCQEFDFPSYLRPADSF